MRVLVVDDEELIRRVIKEYLVIEGFSVDEAINGDEAVNKAMDSKYDLIIMDIMMPKKDGYQASKEILGFCEVPIIMLSARGEEYDKLIGFDVGIDDYITKPFSPKELIARVKAVIKRSSKIKDVINIGDIMIDNVARVVKVNDKEVLLTPKEYELLNYFVINKGIALSREKILTNVWGMNFYGDDRTVDTHIKTLRNNLLECRDYIKTVRGVGYKFEFKE